MGNTGYTSPVSTRIESSCEMRMSLTNSTILRFVKFGFVGGSGIIVNAVLFYLLADRLGTDYRLASICAIECAIVSNFMLNHFWTWSDFKIQGRRRFASRFLKFHLSSGLTALIVNWGLLVVLTDMIRIRYNLPGINDHHISNLIGIGFGAFANFLLSHYWVFRSGKSA